MARIRQDYVDHVREQLEFLESSGRAFDDGKTGEAKRLAVTVRVLLHDTSASKSLLGLMKLKDRFSFLNTAFPFSPHNLMVHHGLVTLQTTSGRGEGGLKYVASLGDRPPPVRLSPFSFWWKELVIKDLNDLTWTRGDVVRQLANREGGAHVDEHLTDIYEGLAKHNALGWMYTYTDETGAEFSGPAEGNPVTVSMRQIAYEVEMTLKRELPRRVPGF